MSDLFLFRFDDGHNKGTQSIVVFSASELKGDAIEAIIKKDVSINLTPSKIYLLGLNSLQDSISRIFEDEQFAKVVSSLISRDESCIEFFSVTTDGDFIDFKTSVKVNFQLQNKILQSGSVDIFKRRKGVLTSSPHYHFVKPSGDHCDKFIRVSNLLTSGNEVAFMALGLLPRIIENIKHIYVDTSSISFLIMTALQLSMKYQKEIPTIESFESYAALSKEHDFIEGPATFVFISATTSGGLVSKLGSSTNLYRDRIFTLFYSQLGLDQIGIYDICSAMTNGIYSIESENCKLCKENSKLIHIVGEQFLPETPRHEMFLIKKDDFSSDRARFFKNFVSNGLLHWNKATKQNINEHFYIDTREFLNNDELSEGIIEDLKMALNKSFSRDIKTIITLDDDGSQALKEKVISYLGSDESSIKWLSLEDLENNSEFKPNSAMVIAGTITSGRKLLSASRKLRILEKSASIKYLVAISKLPTKKSKDQLRKDLQQGGHELIILKDCPVPRVKEHIVTAWDLETLILNEIDDPLSDVDIAGPLPTVLSQRKSDLSGNVDSQNGLFLDTPNDEKLTLREGFAFWADLKIDCNKVSQADVYWAIQAILHDLRLKNADTGLDSTYHSTVLSPICFDRYNDGVIQACFLRAATPEELDYTIDENFSRQMTDVLISIIQNWAIDQGEASFEFLMALATGRLKVLPSDLKEILKVSTEPSSNATIKFMADYIVQKQRVNL